MREIMRVPAEGMRTFAQMGADAYPILHYRTEEDYNKLITNLRAAEEGGFCSGIFGLYESGQLLGGMRVYNFRMQVYETPILVGGIGFVGVSLLHKKEKVAKDMLYWFMQYFKGQGAPMVALYAFRLDFYYKMGFGYGAKGKHYYIKPSGLPGGRPKDKLRFAGPEDYPRILECYHRFAAPRHGMMHKTMYEIEHQVESTGAKFLIYEQDGRIEGYIPFHFSGEDHGHYVLHVLDLVYEHREALLQIMSFLQSQMDQVSRISINTPEEDFYFLLNDPTNGEINYIRLHHQCNEEEIGIMYRLVDTRAFFEQLKGHSFGGQNLFLKIKVKDSFFPENEGSLTLQFENGYPEIMDNTEAGEVEISLDVAELSSLVMGVVKFSSLYYYGKAEISDKLYLHKLDALFCSGPKPMCMTRF